MATKAPVYKVIPTIELQASDLDYSNQLDAALFLAKFDHQQICLVSDDGRQIFCNRSLLSIFSKSIRNILDSSLVHQIPDTAPIILVPDCSGDSISKVHDILLNGSTRCSISSFNDINNVIETAKALGIEMKDLGFVPYSSVEQRRPIPQQIPKPIAPPPPVPYKVTIPPTVDDIEIKKEKADDDISIVGFAGDPNKAVPLNIKVENLDDKISPEVGQGIVKPTIGNSEESTRTKRKKKKKHHKSTEKSTTNDEKHRNYVPGVRKEKFGDSQFKKNIRPLSESNLCKSKSSSNFVRPGSLDENRPLSAKSVEVNKVHHARLAEMSDDELAFTSNTNYSTPPYTKTSITNPALDEEETVTMVSPDFFEEPDDDQTNDFETIGSDHVSSSATVVDVTTEEGIDVQNSKAPYEDVVSKAVEEEVPVSFIEEEILPASDLASMDENEVGPMRPLTEELLQSNHLNINEDKTSHGVGEEFHRGEEIEESGLNDASYYAEDMERGAQDQNEIFGEESSTQESFYGFPDLSASENRDLSLMQIEPSHFGKETNVSEIEDVELQIKRLEKELDNTLDTDVGEEPSAIKVPKTYEFNETSKAETLYKGFSSDDENDDFLDYNEAIRGKDETNLGENKSIPSEDTLSTYNDQQNSDPFKSLLVDNYINRISEKEGKDVEDKEMSTDTDVPTTNHDELTPPVSESSVTEELEKIFGEGVEKFDEQMKNCTSTSLPNQGDLESGGLLTEIEKGEQRSILTNMIVNHPSEKLANLIGNNSISIGRMNEEIKRKPDFNSDYSSLRIERVKAKDREPEGEATTTEPVENQPLRIERVGSSDRIKSRLKHESWMTGKGVTRRSGTNSPTWPEVSKDIESKQKEEENGDKNHWNPTINDLAKMSMNVDFGTEFTAPKRYRSNSPALRPGLAFERADNNLEMSMAKRSKKTEKFGHMKASNLDLQINKLKQTYASGPVPSDYEEKWAKPEEQKDLSSMTISQLVEASKSVPNPHATYSNNHSCVICQKSDFSGSNDTNKLTSIKAHYCGHFREEILDLHKDDIVGNTCMIDGCSMTISDKSDTKRNLARHIGVKHNKIYKILKLRGHKIEFLRNREDKQKPKENKIMERKSEVVVNRVQSIAPKPVGNDRKPPVKTVGKIECNFCSRKYSNNFNLRKHILAAHDKMLD